MKAFIKEFLSYLHYQNPSNYIKEQTFETFNYNNLFHAFYIHYLVMNINYSNS